MTPVEPPAIASGLVDAVHAKLQNAAAPLKLAEVAKGLPKPKKMKAAEFLEEVRQVLGEEVRIGRTFCAPSGKNEETRDWCRDEKQHLREKVVEFAATPQPLSAFKTKLSKEVKGTDGAFVEVVVRELIGADHLFEHVPKTSKSGPLFGASPPPPPLEQVKYKKAVDKLVDACQKLLTAAGAQAEELFSILRTRMRGVQPIEGPDQSRPALFAPEGTRRTEAIATNGAILEELILKAVGNAPVLSLAELRGEMPLEFRGQAFDEVVLRLADRQQVIVSQDADPSRYSDAERAAFVQDGGNLLTTISQWR